jgi:hypothetical protein
MLGLPYRDGFEVLHAIRSNRRDRRDLGRPA